MRTPSSGCCASSPGSSRRPGGAGWAVNKLADISALRRAAQAVVDELGKATTLEVFHVIAEAYNVGARAGLLELGALHIREAARMAPRRPSRALWT